MRRLTTGRIIAAAAAAAVAFTAASARGQTYSPVQSSARPFGLDIVDPVQLRNTDAGSSDFTSNGSPWLNSVINNGINNPLTSGSATTMIFDPGRIELATDWDVRMYFFGEDAGFHNSLGFNPNGSGVSSGAELIFPDASEWWFRISSYPVQSGDFVDLGNWAAGSVLDFFVIADGANGGTDVFSMDASQNPDGLNHVTVHARTDVDSPYLLLGFEDMYGGGDGDMNDLVVGLDIGVQNVRNLINSVGSPEPGSLATLGVFLACAGCAGRRRRPARSDSGRVVGAVQEND